jgi:pyruvate dehydrogenase E2 component (dihydrolipoamide acetyltransferase)
MGEKIILPKMDQDMETGILAAWHVAVGDVVKAGDEIAEMETAKVTAVIESSTDGTVLALLVEAGDEIPVGTVIAVIGEAGESMPDAEAEADSTPEPAPAEPAPPIAVSPSVSPAGPGAVEPVAVRTLPLPVAERMLALPADRSGWARPHRQSPRARFEGGPAATAPSTSNGRVEPLSQVRKRTVSTVEASWRIPQFSVEAKVKLLPAIEALAGVREAAPDAGITLTDLLALALAKTAQEVPEVNAWFEGDSIRYFDQVDLSLMVQGERGLFVPAIRGVGKLGLAGIAAERRRLIDAVRGGMVSADDLAPGSIALSNLGMYKVDRFNALLYPPQVAILAVGRAGKRKKGAPVWLTLTVDHRAVDGATAARCLERLATYVGQPALLII